MCMGVLCMGMCVCCVLVSLCCVFVSFYVFYVLKCQHHSVRNHLGTRLLLSDITVSFVACDLLQLIGSQSDDVLKIASSTLCNLLLDFSPSKEVSHSHIALCGFALCQSECAFTLNYDKISSHT